MSATVCTVYRFSVTLRSRCCHVGSRAVPFAVTVAIPIAITIAIPVSVATGPFPSHLPGSQGAVTTIAEVVPGRTPANRSTCLPVPIGASSGAVRIPRVPARSTATPGIAAAASTIPASRRCRTSPGLVASCVPRVPLRSMSCFSCSPLTLSSYGLSLSDGLLGQLPLSSFGSLGLDDLQVQVDAVRPDALQFGSSCRFLLGRVVLEVALKISRLTAGFSQCE